MHICRVATVPFFFNHHLRVQLRHLVESGHHLDLVCSGGPGFEELSLIGRDVAVHRIEIPRPIFPLGDLKALAGLLALFQRHQYDVVHSTTPKAGLLSAIAANLAGVPVRLHTFTGQQWAELSGPVRTASIASDVSMVQLNTRCYADSVSQREFLIRQNIASKDRIGVLGDGSLAGVDVQKLELIRATTDRDRLRRDLRIPHDAHLITFVGRVTRDKGVLELLAAFEILSQELGNCFLLIVGPCEVKNDIQLENRIMQAGSNSRIRIVGYDPAPEKFFCISSLLCLPSYREGFGNVVLEAGIMEVPTVGTQIVGLIDAVEHNQTGILVPVKDPMALKVALADLLLDPCRRQTLGLSARSRVLSRFDARRISNALLNEYGRLAKGGCDCI